MKQFLLLLPSGWHKLKAAMWKKDWDNRNSLETEGHPKYFKIFFECIIVKLNINTQDKTLWKEIPFTRDMNSVLKVAGRKGDTQCGSQGQMAMPLQPDRTNVYIHINCKTGRSHCFNKANTRMIRHPTCIALRRSCFPSNSHCPKRFHCRQIVRRMSKPPNPRVPDSKGYPSTRFFYGSTTIHEPSLHNGSLSLKLSTYKPGRFGRC